MKKAYWVVMADRDGGESDPFGPYSTKSEAESAGENRYDELRWVSYEIFEYELGD
jgi:hypothetical protein